jgi:hypothetical protein
MLQPLRKCGFDTFRFGGAIAGHGSAVTNRDAATNRTPLGGLITCGKREKWISLGEVIKGANNYK